MPVVGKGRTHKVKRETTPAISPSIVFWHVLAGPPHAAPRGVRNFPGGRCKFDIALLVVTEWHCLLFRPGEVADCPLGCVAVDAALATRGPQSGVDRGVDSPKGDRTLASLPQHVDGAGGRG